MKVYLSIAHRGEYAQHNRQAAARLCAMLTLENEGWEVVNPFAIIDRYKKRKMEVCGRIVDVDPDGLKERCLSVLRECDIMLVSDEKERSEIYEDEKAEAMRIGMRIMELSEMRQTPPYPAVGVDR